MNSEITELWRRANEIVAMLELWILEHDEKSIHLTISRENQVRLLKLRTWQFRYYLPIRELLDILVPLLRDRVKRTKSSYGLGIGIRSLTGKGAEDMLKVEIARRYPGNEHIQVWKEMQRDQQLELELLEETDGMAVRPEKLITIQNAESAEQFLASYTKQIEARRKTVQSDNSQRQKKKYRGNPWL